MPLTSIGDSEEVLGRGAQVMPGQPLQNDQDAAIRIPALLFNLINDRDNVGLFFALYDTPTLFPVGGGNDVNSNAPTGTEVGSRILAATVGPGLNFQNLTVNITIVLRLVTEQNVRL